MKSRSTEDLHRITSLFWLFFKILPMVIAGFAIYLGYKLFVLGVTGEASIVIDAKNVRGQMINAAPGLFFAVGGFITLIIAIVKGGTVTYSDREAGIDELKREREIVSTS